MTRPQGHIREEVVQELDVVKTIQEQNDRQSDCKPNLETHLVYGHEVDCFCAEIGSL